MTILLSIFLLSSGLATNTSHNPDFFHIVLIDVVVDRAKRCCSGLNKVVLKDCLQFHSFLKTKITPQCSFQVFTPFYPQLNTKILLHKVALRYVHHSTPCSRQKLLHKQTEICTPFQYLLNTKFIPHTDYFLYYLILDQHINVFSMNYEWI